MDSCPGSASRQRAGTEIHVIAWKTLTFAAPDVRRGQKSIRSNGFRSALIPIRSGLPARCLPAPRGTSGRRLHLKVLCPVRREPWEVPREGRRRVSGEEADLGGEQGAAG